MNKEEWIAFLRRALWTFAQAFCAVLITKIPEGSAFNQVGWMDILQVAFVAGILSVAKSFLVGVPEAGSYDGTLNIDKTIQGYGSSTLTMTPLPFLIRRQSHLRSSQPI